MEGVRAEKSATAKLLTVTLTEEQCSRLGAMFRERLESHKVRGSTGYPQDEEGARFALDLWRAFSSASSKDDFDRQDGNGCVRRGRHSGRDSEHHIEHSAEGLRGSEEARSIVMAREAGDSMFTEKEGDETNV